MSKIYIISGKSEFVNSSNTNNSEVTLTFIKKYHKYYRYLLFLPTVLADMIFDYINDIFEIKCKILMRDKYDKQISCSNDIQLNFETVLLDFSIFINYYYYILVTYCINRNTKASFKINYMNQLNDTYHVRYFLHTYYKYYKNRYIPNYDNCDKIIKNIDNLKHYKNEIIIIMLIHKLINKKMKNNHH